MALRKRATPATIGTFIVTLITGLLLFFEVGPGSVRATHEWVSIVFAIAVAWHIYVHKKPFLKYFQKPHIAPIVVGLLLGGVVFVSAFNDIYAADAIFNLTVNMELSEAVSVFGVTIDEAVTTLNAEGIAVKDHSQTIVEIANSNEVEVYDIIDPLLELSAL